MARTEPTGSDATQSTVVQQEHVKTGMLSDPLVRRMVYGSFFLVIIFLATVVSALWFGVLNPPAPRTSVERELMLAERLVSSNSSDPKAWDAYVSALIASKQYAKAQDVVNKAKRAKIDDPAKQYFGLAQVRLDMADEDYSKAIKNADETIKALEKQLEVETKKYKATGNPTTMTSEGLGSTYESLLLLKAEAYEKLGKDKQAIESLDKYLILNPRAADILVWRGDLKMAIGDKKGAGVDYKDASQYVRGDKELEAKLRDAGVTND